MVRLPKGKPRSALGTAHGARDMLSTPPAMYDLALAGFDGAHRGVDRRQARGTQTVESDRGHLHREARQQQRHAGDVAVVFAGLVGAAQVHLFNDLELRTFARRRTSVEDQRRQVVRAHLLEHAAMTADGRADRFDDDRFGHEDLRR